MKRHQTVFITGCRGGIGKATAIALAERGYSVIATTHYEKDAVALNAFAAEKDLSIESFQLDITRPEDREQIDNYNVDILINNAALGESGSLAEIPLDRLEANFETNVLSTFALTQRALRQMLAKQHGRIIIISSLGGRVVGMPFLGAYSMTKFALSAGAESLRKEITMLTDQVHVSLIEPGAYHTGFNQKNNAKKYTWMNTDSYFYNLIPRIKRREQWQFRLTEQRRLDSIVRQIVRAVEADKPKLRYSAPWWQKWGAQLLRALGK